MAGRTFRGRHHQPCGRCKIAGFLIVEPVILGNWACKVLGGTKLLGMSHFRPMEHTELTADWMLPRMGG